MSREDRDLRVPLGLYLQTRLVAATARLWELLGDIESTVLGGHLEEIRVSRPVYVCGLARSGTTITTEILSHHPALTCHRYADFPFVYIPYWRNWVAERSRLYEPTAVERAHRDRIMMTPDSPEAVEEVLWMHFFPRLHDAAESNMLDRTSSNPRFEAYYGEHIRKLLLVRRRSRYLAKGNYNLTRLEYLLRLFPDARFVVLIREPVCHIASLMKQHEHFMQAARRDARIAGQLAASGHFEFGPGRTCIHYGDEVEVRHIEACWREGREVEGWARYWNGLYARLAALLAGDADLAEAVMMVRYEALCGDSEGTLRAILGHCGLDEASFQAEIARYSATLTLPDYYRPTFTEAELSTINALTGETAARFGCAAPQD